MWNHQNALTAAPICVVRMTVPSRHHPSAVNRAASYEMLRRALVTPAASALRCAVRRPQLCIRPVAQLQPFDALGQRFCSSKPAAEEEAPATPVDDGKPKLMFEGAKNKIVKTLKMASIANLGFAAASGALAASPNTANIREAPSLIVERAAWQFQSCNTSRRRRDQVAKV